MTRKGLPKSIIKKYGISKKAWAVFRGRKRKRSSNPRPKKARKVRKLARRKRSRRKRSFTLPLAPIAGLAAGMAEPLQAAMQGDYQHALAVVSYNYTGYNPEDRTFNAMRMQRGLLPIIIGCLVHKFVGGAPLNLNRILASAGVPFIRI